MRKLTVIVLLITTIVAVGISESHSGEIRACIGKNRQLRIVNDLSECNQNEQPRTFGTQINNEMPSQEINRIKLSSDQCTLSIKKNGNGRGTVILSPSGVGSDSAPVQKYSKGTLVVLTASPDENSVFTGWKGEGCLGDGICVLTMSFDKTVTATFHETNASGTVIVQNTKKPIIPAMNKRETEQQETKEDERQKMEKTSQPQEPSETLYAVQTGAFRNTSNAKSLQMKLAKKGYHAYILTSKSRKGGEFNKVLIGRFSDRREAEDLSKKILNMENLQTFVTPCGIRQKKLETKQ